MLFFISIGVYMALMAFVLWFGQRITKVFPETPELPEIPDWATPAPVEDYWTQARVDAQFRAMTRPLVK